jgi:N-acetylneuraminate synthase
LNTPQLKEDITDFTLVKTIFGKSLATKIDVKKGNLVSIAELESKKPGDRGIPAKYFEDVLGKQWNTDLPANSFINRNDIV